MKKLKLEKSNFKVNSTGWNKRRRKGTTVLENPKKDIWEYVSGVPDNIIGEQLFTWDAAMRETKLAGKKIPTDKEWNEVKDKLLGCKVLPGYCDTDGTFYGRGIFTSLWSSTASPTTAWIRYLNCTVSTVYRFAYDKADGFSVRCIEEENEIKQLPKIDKITRKNLGETKPDKLIMWDKINEIIRKLNKE